MSDSDYGSYQSGWADGYQEGKNLKPYRESPPEKHIPVALVVPVVWALVMALLIVAFWQTGIL